jgi:hypothetical protein
MARHSLGGYIQVLERREEEEERERFYKGELGLMVVMGRA